MKWEKLGNIFNPDLFQDWNFSFGAVPYVGEIKDNQVKIYFTGRDQDNRSHIHWAIFDFADNFKVLELSDVPVLAPGGTGLFDEHGVMGSQIIELNNETYLYYFGWNLAISVPFRNSIGVAKLDKKEGKFIRMFKGPLVDRSIHDNCFVATPCVVELEENSFVMYYLSCDKWEHIDGVLRHRYNIKIAVSNDGINWNREGKIAIDYANEHEYAISVPRVLREDGIFKMWFSFRSDSTNRTYRMGYAESNDAFNWTRKDEEVGITVSEEGWDAEMTCYPFIFDHGRNRYMLYNGNGYGKTGFGLAVLEQD